jgi:hypothetical protein
MFGLDTKSLVVGAVAGYFALRFVPMILSRGAAAGGAQK